MFFPGRLYPILHDIRIYIFDVNSTQVLYILQLAEINNNTLNVTKKENIF